MRALRPELRRALEHERLDPGDPRERIARPGRVRADERIGRSPLARVLAAREAKRPEATVVRPHSQHLLGCYGSRRDSGRLFRAVRNEFERVIAETVEAGI